MVQNAGNVFKNGMKKKLVILKNVSNSMFLTLYFRQNGVVNNTPFVKVCYLF